eukprot:scaffold524243_cov13-Prasinocladus_malaysianus.AAC.1
MLPGNYIGFAGGLWYIAWTRRSCAVNLSMSMIETQAVGSVGYCVSAVLELRCDSLSSQFFAFVRLLFCTDLELVKYLLIDKQPAASLWRQQAGAVRPLNAQDNGAPSNVVAERESSDRSIAIVQCLSLQ